MGLRFVPMSDLNQKLRWLIALRLLIVTSLTSIYALYQLNVGFFDLDGHLSSTTLALLTTFGATSALTLIYLGCFRFLEDRPKLHAYLQFCGDLVLITVLIIRLEEEGRTFTILFFVVITLASVLIRRSAGVVMATLASLCFALITFKDTLPWPSLLEDVLLVSETSSPEGSNGDLFLLGYNLTVHLAGFYAIAFLTSYLARNVDRAEQRLKARDLDLASLEVVHGDVVQSISSGLMTTDLRGAITSLNPSCKGLVERPLEELQGHHVTETGLFDLETWRDLTEQTARGDRRTELVHDRNGIPIHIGMTLNPLRDAELRHHGYTLILEDLTERRRLQAELRTKDRMAAIGEMAAGLAHEVGNPLASIMGSVQVLLSHSFEDAAAQRKLLDILLREGERLDRIVKSFLQLAASRGQRLEDVDIAALLDDDVELLRLSDKVQSSHEIDLGLEPSSAIIRADPDQMSQVFWNLAQNALKAMPEGGRLEIRGRLEETIYRLTFHDNGAGMTEEERMDIFHPFKSFFDQGTGLGMAIVYRIVQEHGGKITAESEPGVGTVFDVELPIDGPPPPSSETGGGTETAEDIA